MATTLPGRDPAPAGQRPAALPAIAGRRRRWARRGAAAALLALAALGLVTAGVNGWAEYHFRAAKRENERFHFQNARRHIDQTRRVWPNSARVNFLAARTARRFGDLDAAERHLALCQDRAAIPDDDIVLERMLIRCQRGDVRDVEPALRDLIEKKHPDSALIFEAMARTYALQVRFFELDNLLALWLERDPNNTLALFFQAWVREQLGPREEAVTGYCTVLDRDPDNDEARLRLANLLLERSLPKEAFDLLQELARRNPDNVTVKVRLARAWHDLGELDRAQALLDDVLEREPNYAFALTARGRLALQQGQPEVAETFLRRSLQIDRSDYQTVFLLHQSLERQNKTEAAKKVEGQVILLGADLRHLHDIVTTEIPLRRDDPAVYVEAGVLCLRIGDTSEGLRWFGEALKLDPLYPRAHAELAKHFEAAGDAQRARRHRQLAEQTR
jgi:tetratricopeptide (TPR) repeat protein